MFVVTIKEACLIDVAVANSHLLHNVITKKPQKYTAVKGELTMIWQPNTDCVVPLPLSTMRVIPNKLHASLKPHSLPSVHSNAENSNTKYMLYS